MDNTKWSYQNKIIIFIAGKDGEALYSQPEQDWELTVDQIMNPSIAEFRHKLWRRQWHPTPVLLPGGSQGLGSLVGCRLWGHTESDTTEAT